MNKRLEWRIVAFFQYWQHRLTFIQGLDNQHRHEANVLIYAALDALSNLWSQHIGKVECAAIKKRKRLIFDAFLSRYGGDTFQVVSLPDVWNRIDRGDIFLGQKSLSTDVVNILGKIGNRQEPTFTNKRRLRQSSEDWSLDRVTTAVLAECPTANQPLLEDWLTLSKYGAIAYKEMRSAYIHEGRSGKGSHGYKLSNSAILPTYQSGIYTTPPAIGFSIEFMTKVLEDCINGFESTALALQQDPVPD